MMSELHGDCVVIRRGEQEEILKDMQSPSHKILQGLNCD